MRAPLAAPLGEPHLWRVRVELRRQEEGTERLVEVAFLRPTVRELRELCARHGVKTQRFRFERGGLCVVAAVDR